MSIPIALAPIVYMFIGTPSGTVAYASFPDHTSCWKAVKAAPIHRLLTCLTEEEAREQLLQVPPL